MSLTNFYETIKKEKDDGLRNYPNEEEIGIKLPARMLICGPSGSMKTNLVLNLMKMIGTFDKIVLLAKQLDQPLYKHLIEVYRKLEKKHKIQMLLAIDKIEDLPALTDFNPKENSFLIVDDFICESPKVLKQIEEYWVRGRHQGISMAFLTQSYFDTPKNIRKNSNYVMIKKVGNPKDLGRILREFTLGVTEPELKSLYMRALSDGKQTSFFMIDVDNFDPHMRFRANFAPMG
jgi:hypothetical protein